MKPQSRFQIRTLPTGPVLEKTVSSPLWSETVGRGGARWWNLTKSNDYQQRAEECQRMATLAPTDREKRSWMELGESWLRMIEVRKVILPGADQNFNAEVEQKGTGQTRSKSSN